jgi:hypothetical protein
MEAPPKSNGARDILQVVGVTGFEPVASAV